MLWFPILLCLAIVLAAVLTVIGRMAVLALHIDLFDGDEPEHWLAALVFGTGLTTLLCGWCAYSGLASHEYRWIVLATLGVLLFGVICQGRASRLFPFATFTRWHALVGTILLVRLGIQLLPVLGRGCHTIISDAALYTGAAEYLSRNGFGEPIMPTLGDPIQASMAAFHWMNHRMGPMFLHSLVVVGVPELQAFETFAVMMALGAILNLAAVYLICRWCFNLSTRDAAIGLLVIALMSHTLMDACTGSFLCQVYGTAVLGTAIACMPRLLEPARWTAGNALLVGCLLSFQMSMYSELTPVLGLAGLVWLVCGVRAAVRTKSIMQFLLFLVLCVSGLLLVGNIEIYRCWRGVQTMMELSGVGYHIPWNKIQYAEFALGSSGFQAPLGASFHSVKRLLCTPATLLLFAAGFMAIVRGGGIFVGVSLGVLAVLFAFFAIFRTDPWTGVTGHSWNLFKLAKWAYPFVAAIQIAGLAWWMRAAARSQCLRIGLTIVLCALLGTNLYQIQLGARPFGYNDAFRAAGGESPYTAVRGLRARLNELPGNIYIVRVPFWHTEDYVTAGFLHPRRTANDWLMSYEDARKSRSDASLDATNVHYLHNGPPPFDAPLEQLPFRYSLLDPEKPTLFRVYAGELQFVPAPNRFLPIGSKPVTCWIFAPREEPAEMAIEWADGLQVTGVTLNVVDDDGERSQLMQAAPHQTLSLKLKRGVNRVVFTATREIQITAIHIRWEAK